MNNVICSNNISFGVSMKICIVSAKPRVGSKKKNLDKIEKYISQEKADMYVFGELFLTGLYHMRCPLKRKGRYYLQLCHFDSSKW